jgi:hypothetical protein
MLRQITPRNYPSILNARIANSSRAISGARRILALKWVGHFPCTRLELPKRSLNDLCYDNATYSAIEQIETTFCGVMIRMTNTDNIAATRNRTWDILGCALIGCLGIVILNALTFWYGTYYSDGILVLYPVAVNSMSESLKIMVRPIEYLIILAANKVYLPLWLCVSLACMVGASILSALACELVFERQLSRTGWWVLGLANPLLFYPVSQPIVSQALSNLLFAGGMFAFALELRWLTDRPPSEPRPDRASVFLNVLAAALFFTKETAVAAAVVLPGATVLIRLRAGRLSPAFLSSLLLVIGAGCGWYVLKANFSYLIPTGRYSLHLNPIAWGENLIITLAYPITPLPSSFIAFEVLRPVWVVVALVSVALFVRMIVRESLREPKIIFPLLVVIASCSPMILVRVSELYPSMIAPFAVSIVLLCGFSKMRQLCLIYGVLLYSASLGNGIIYSLGSSFNLLGLQRLQYSIYTKEYQFNPICTIGTTAHVGWDPTTANDLSLYLPGVKGAITCIR